MKKLLILPLAMLVLYSCGNSSKTSEQEVASVDEFSKIAKNMNDEHNAKNSLDIIGTYKGTLPTASGEGMQVVITLNDNAFTKTTTYIGKKDSTSEEKGNFSWNVEGNTITLDGIDSPNQYFVGENTLIQLDMEGNRIVGNLADKYVLRK
ncbi:MULTISPECIES: copper resistance protein NlpE [unclassified Dysgonomonas]|uniref:copper resistance protein NlpE n=1 Tax=unclassified Dysgonomonas TaxID=2630389 RepID=UPI0013EDE48F|nr:MULTISPECIES: copper resistance protein NlpE [unclassified Dysgonomonas]